MKDDAIRSETLSPACVGVWRCIWLLALMLAVLLKWLMLLRCLLIVDADW